MVDLHLMDVTKTGIIKRMTTGNLTTDKNNPAFVHKWDIKMKRAACWENQPHPHWGFYQCTLCDLLKKQMRCIALCSITKSQWRTPTVHAGGKPQPMVIKDQTGGEIFKQATVTNWMVLFVTSMSHSSQNSYIQTEGFLILSQSLIMRNPPQYSLNIAHPVHEVLRNHSSRTVNEGKCQWGKISLHSSASLDALLWPTAEVFSEHRLDQLCWWDF